MKILILTLFSVYSLNSFATWADSDFTEPAIGCAVLGGAMYLMSNANTDSSGKFQNLFVGCAIGGATMYGVNSYYEKKVGDKYKADISKLQGQLKLFQRKDAIDASLGISTDHYIEYETIPGTQNPDGSLNKETLRLRLKQPGNDLNLGN